MVRLAFALLLVACGRVHFDPLDGSTDGAQLTYRAAVLADQPVTYWRLADGDATARDEMALYDGTYSGGCTQSVTGALADDPDSAVHFDGTSCRVDFTGHLDFSGTAAFTVELWVSLDVLGGLQPYIMNEERVGPGPTNGFALLEGQTGANSYIERTSSGSNRFTPRYPSPVGAFVHYVGIFDGTQLRLYANGVQYMNATAVTAATDMTRAKLTLGCYPPGSGNNFLVGTLDEVAVYDHVLTDERIALHYLIGSQGPQPLP